MRTRPGGYGEAMYMMDLLASVNKIKKGSTAAYIGRGTIDI